MFSSEKMEFWGTEKYRHEDHFRVELQFTPTQTGVIFVALKAGEIEQKQ